VTLIVDAVKAILSDRATVVSEHNGTQMHQFRLKYTASGLSAENGKLSFDFKLNHQIKVTISEPDEDYKKHGESATVFCDSELALEPTQKITKVFTDLVDGQFLDPLRDDFALPTPFQRLTNHHGKKIILPPLFVMPEYFQEFAKAIEAELSSAIKRVVNTLRWFLDKRGAHNPYSFRKFEWTSDGEHWYSMPNAFEISIESYSNSIRLEGQDSQIVSQLLNEDWLEPVHHSLFRESWSQRHQNPRSAVIMGMSALEVAMKYLIEHLVPHATWLMTTIPSPPLHRILAEYLPMLPLDNKVNAKPVLPSKLMIDRVRKWVVIRNEITHLGRDAIKQTELDELLLTIKDILHIVDFNCGHRWALNHVRAETLLEIGI
jgi:hypothetical protein